MTKPLYFFCPTVGLNIYSVPGVRMHNIIHQQAGRSTATVTKYFKVSVKVVFTLHTQQTCTKIFFFFCRSKGESTLWRRLLIPTPCWIYLENFFFSFFFTAVKENKDVNGNSIQRPTVFCDGQKETGVIIWVSVHLRSQESQEPRCKSLKPMGKIHIQYSGE